MTRLDYSDCKLLQDDALVDRFNKVDQVFAEALDVLPRFGQREAVGKIKAELSRLAAVMVRPRFTIGFIGPSQAGKSTTVGNLLAVSKDESPAPQGTGGPTTSVPTRLIPCREPHASCAAGERHGIELKFLTRKQFQERVSDICSILKLTYDENVRRLLEATRAQHAEQPHFMAADHRVLIGLLEAALEFSDVIQDTATIEVGIYSKRRDYATHQDKPSKYTLLSEVLIYFITDAMSLDIEMIDLPGLGVDKESDDRLTLAFLPQLDGAFMFQLASQVKSAEISRLAGKMRQQHSKSLGGRVWMVVTRCDDLNELQLSGPPEDPTQPSMFCHLNQTLGNQGLSEDAVIFVGNAYHKELLAAHEQGESGVPATVRQRFPTVLQFDEQDEPVVPDRCLQYAGQIESWRRFVLEGGMPHLRETMQTKVADSVRQQTCRDVAKALDDVVNKMIGELEVAEQQSGMSVDEMRNAAVWSGRLAVLAADFISEPYRLQPLVDAVEGNMDKLLEEWGMPPPDQLAANHTNLTKTLARSAVGEAEQATRQAVDDVKRKIEEGMTKSPCPDAAGLPKPLEYWAAQAEEYLESGKTLEGVPGQTRSREYRRSIFGMLETDASPFEGREAAQLSTEDYSVVMRQKVARVAKVYGSRLATEVHNHLMRLADRYRAVGADADNVDTDARAAYAEYRARLLAMK
jgi:hypothetical protein